MLPLSEIRPYFSEDLHRFPRFMLREYPQFKTLEIILVHQLIFLIQEIFIACLSKDQYIWFYYKVVFIK